MRLILGFYAVAALVVAERATFAQAPASAAGQVSFAPAQPRVGNEIRVTYRPADPTLATAGLELVYGLSIEDAPRPNWRFAPLRAISGELVAQLRVSATANYVWAFVRDSAGKREDTNNGVWWGTYVVDAAGRPVQGAYFSRAELLSRLMGARGGAGGVSDESNRAVADSLIYWLEQELAINPGHAQARVELWTRRYSVQRSRAAAEDAAEDYPKAQRYLTEKGYDFVSLFDDERLRQLKLPFIPGRVVLDQTGRLRMRSIGYTPESAASFDHKIQALIGK
jgi:hypothetical protein